MSARRLIIRMGSFHSTMIMMRVITVKNSKYLILAESRYAKHKINNAIKQLVKI